MVYYVVSYIVCNSVTEYYHVVSYSVYGVLVQLSCTAVFSSARGVCGVL